MKNSSKSGNYYKIKSKKWFQNLGYFVEYLEKYQRLFVKGRVINIKRDLFASDGLAIKKDQLIFWQSKLGRKNIAKGIAEYNKYPFPDFVDRWILVWAPRVKEPEIIEVKNE